MANKKKKQKVEFSKLIFIGVTIATVIVTIFSLILMWVTKDTSALAYLIPAIYGELISATGFYYNKAKAENQLKITLAYKKHGLTEEEKEGEDIVWNSMER